MRKDEPLAHCHHASTKALRRWDCSVGHYCFGCDSHSRSLLWSSWPPKHRYEYRWMIFTMCRFHCFQRWLIAACYIETLSRPANWPQAWWYPRAASGLPSRLLCLSQHVIQSADINAQHAPRVMQLKTDSQSLIEELEVLISRSRCMPTRLLVRCSSFSFLPLASGSDEPFSLLLPNLTGEAKRQKEACECPECSRDNCAVLEVCESGQATTCDSAPDSFALEPVIQSWMGLTRTIRTSVALQQQRLARGKHSS